MRVIILVATIVMTRCDVTNNESKLEDIICGHGDHHNIEDAALTRIKAENHSGIPNDSVVAQTLARNSRPSREQGINQELKEIMAASTDYVRNLNKSVPKNRPGEAVEQVLFQSDVVPTKRQSDNIFNDVMTDGDRRKRQVMKHKAYPNSTWKNGVFYTFNTSDPVVQKLFKMGANVWSEVTCIDFIEDKNAHDKVVVVKKPDSFSSVGRRGGDQALSLGEDDPTVGSAVHEIGHVLGFFHTMERYDRDKYIKIFEKNINPNMLSEFEKIGPSYIDVYGLMYDYGSVMHYDDLGLCSKNKRPTIIARDPRHQNTMGSELIAFSDIFVINQHYGCNAKCDMSISVKCANGGFPHPRNCSRCICPGGYGGILCDRRPSGCGEDLMATNKTKSVVYRLGFGTTIRDEFNFCHYIITAPEGKRIEVNVRSISHGYDVGGCRKGGVEIKAQEDQRLTGYR